MNAPSPHVWARPTPLSDAEHAKYAHISGLASSVTDAIQHLTGLYIRHAAGHILAPTDTGIREICQDADKAIWARLDSLNKALLELADPDECHRLVDETDRLEPGNMGAALRHAILSSNWSEYEAGFGSFGSAA
ncbi:hypothetical protein ASF53_19505 [Methylobacterium sp. Leaf123]|uniref:hypothetical protein n=1 Tax=Methylobacterium sp. Leaf123 TaxID=1736264 RepID=UPI0007004E0F|nr:hypothetical protein [Methylobacterium sp. Leaf123]KQQ29420.1 hypothetical protein ASF53_19505 [Methylobacterium sp. Leaf123]